jgi:hypothetical protein
VRRTETVKLAPGAAESREYRMERWANLPARGWYSADWMLVRFHDTIEELMGCSSRFDRAIAIIEARLLDSAESKATALLRASGSLRLVARIPPDEPDASLERMLLFGCYGFVSDRISAASLQRTLRGWTWVRS